jgi:hypothetical protein
VAWEGKTLAEICGQGKDPARNRNRSVDPLIEHIGEDDLVGCLGARIWLATGSRHAEASGSAGRSVGESRGEVPQLLGLDPYARLHTT